MHYYISVPIYYESDSFEKDNVNFLFDTGAFITVLNRDTARRFGFGEHNIVRRDIPLTGFAGAGGTGDLLEIPGMRVGERRLKSVKVAVPHKNADTKYNIIGLNVLEHFKYLIDTENEEIYLADNPNYKMPNELKCTRVLAIADIPIDVELLVT